MVEMKAVLKAERWVAGRAALTVEMKAVLKAA
jgi:hypothetical protein